MFAKYMFLEDDRDDSDLAKPWLRWKTVSKTDEVLQAFEKLDGERYSILFVSENSPPKPLRDEPFFAKTLALGGGKHDQYLCEAYIEDAFTSITLCSPNAANPREFVPLKRGQLETFPRYYIVSGDMARRALTEFAETGKLCDAFTWEDEATRSGKRWN